MTYTDTGIFSSTGDSITWTRDDLGRITSLTDPDGHIIAYDYDAHGDLIQVTDQVGNATSFTYRNNRAHFLDTLTDPLGDQAIRTEYDETGRVTAIYDALGNSINQMFDLDNNREIIQDQLGNDTTLVYDDRGNILQEIDPLGHSIIHSYDENDNEIATTGKRGFTTTFTYDTRGNITSVTDALGGVTTTTYNQFGQVLTQTDALGRLSSNTYDLFGNLTVATDAGGFTQMFTYDDVGRVVTHTDEAGFTTRFVYGNGPSPTQVINPDSSSRFIEYNIFGQVTRSEDELGRITLITFDRRGLPISLTDPLGAVTHFAFDANGRLTSLTDPAGNVTQYEFDSFGNLVRKIDPLGLVTAYDYDALNRLVRLTDRNARLTEYTYDSVGNLTTERWLTNGSVVRETTSTYDEAGNLLTIQDPDSRYTFTYDELGRVLSDDNLGTSNSARLILTYAYDVVGNLLSTTDNFGVTVTSSYDQWNLLASRTWTGSSIDPVRVEFTYDERGLRNSVTRYGDATGTSLIGSTMAGYDDRGRLIDLDHRDAVDAVFADYDWLFDEAGQITQESYNGNVVDYTYDDFGQLMIADHSDQTDENYTYDENGNRTNTGYETGPANQLTTDGTFNYDYDAEGNLIRKAEIATGKFVEYHYDHRNRLVQATTYSADGISLQEIDFTYDAFDRRIAKSVDTDGVGPESLETHIFLYDGLHTWADADASGTINARYLYGNVIDELIARYRVNEGVAWYLTDHLGTVRDIVDASGTVIDHVEYDSFGNIVSETDAAAGDRFKFTGREWDIETGLYYYRTRYYDAITGRFISTDPLSFSAGDPNPYRYVFNSTTIFLDPLGLVEITVEGVFDEETGLPVTASVARAEAALHRNLIATLQETLHGLPGTSAMAELIRQTLIATQEDLTLIIRFLAKLDQSGL